MSKQERRSGKAKFRVGDRVQITLPGRIESTDRLFVYVRIIVKGENGNKPGTAICYRNEVRPLTKKEKGDGK